MATGKPIPDWERIELDYRAGMKTLRQIADGAGVSHVAIAKRAKKLGWVRDLSAKIQAQAENLVNRQAVNAQVNAETKIAERQLVDANAQAVADVRLAQRRDIKRARDAVNALLTKLEHQVKPENVAALDELGELMRHPDDCGRDKLNDLYRQIISLPVLAKTMKDLGESLRVLVGLERQAFGMDDKDKAPDDPLRDLAQALLGNVVGPGGIDLGPE